MIHSIFILAMLLKYICVTVFFEYNKAGYVGEERAYIAGSNPVVRAITQR
jgi:hypothetical protein